jgi:hypothetical protein
VGRTEVGSHCGKKKIRRLEFSKFQTGNDVSAARFLLPVTSLFLSVCGFSPPSVTYDLLRQMSLKDTEVTAQFEEESELMSVNFSSCVST